MNLRPRRHQQLVLSSSYPFLCYLWFKYPRYQDVDTTSCWWPHSHSKDVTNVSRPIAYQYSLIRWCSNATDDVASILCLRTLLLIITIKTCHHSLIISYSQQVTRALNDRRCTYYAANSS